MASGANPNVAALSITDFVSLYTLKATGSGEYLAASALALLRELGVSIVWSTALTTGQAVVADSRIAGRIIVREGANITMSDSDQDDFLRNQVTILAEGRFGLEVEQPAAICKVALA
jgi:HK97 family phage major capsid protein